MSDCCNHQPVTGDGVPKAVGPYSPGIRWGEVVFCSGQLGIDPATGKLVEGVEAQTRQALANLKTILGAAGSSINCVVKTTVFLKDIGDFPAMNEVYAGVFSENRPARSTVEVSAMALDALVEIEAIAHVP